MSTNTMSDGMPQTMFHSIGNIDGMRHRGFQAPFSERRLILMVGDILSLIVAISITILLGGWINQFNLPFLGPNIVASTSGLLKESITSSGTTFLSMLDQWDWLLVWIAIWWVSSHLNDLYDIPTSYNKGLTAFRVFVATQVAFVIYAPISFLIFYPLPFFLVLLSLVLAIPLLILWRLLYIRLSALRAFRYRVLILGTGEKADSIAKLLVTKPELNFEVLGYVSDVDESQTEIKVGLERLPVLGTVSQLPQLIRETKAHELVVACSKEIEQELFQHLVECQATGVGLTWMPDLYARMQRSIPIEHIDTSWAFHALQGKALFWRMQLGAKRVLDLLLLLFGLPVLLFLMPILALLIRLDTPGPIFYRQIRCGRAGRPFAIYKFRTMVVDAEADGKARWSSKGDSRITRVGLFLRKSRLDELPQLLNVLRGDMSFIGPRPERPDFVKELRQQIPFYNTRMMVKPGITGWAQVHYDYGNSAEDALVKLKYDFYYIYHWSFWLDLYTLFKTLNVVAKLKGV